MVSSGAIGVAFGAETRHEANNLPFWDGQGNFQGLSLTSYSGKRNIAAAYSEVLLPVLKQLELNAANQKAYDDAVKARDAEIARFNAAYEAAMKKWQEDVAACKAEDTTRCGVAK